MSLVNVKSLVRGKTLVDYAYSRKGFDMNLDPGDYIGIVAAFLSRGGHSGEIEEELAASLNPDIGHKARSMFDLFDDRHGRGLWVQGAAMDDVTLVHPTLIKFFTGMSEL